MIGQPRKAKIAAAAGDVDFADDALAGQLAIRRLDDMADELMARHAVEAHVPLAISRSVAQMPA